MRVPLTVRDHLDRALAVYPERIAFVDEPDQPAPSLGETRFSQLGELSRTMGAGLDRLGLDGEITEVNSALEATPELVNDKPYEAGWMVKIRLGDAGQLESLLSAEGYRSFLEEEGA